MLRRVAAAGYDLEQSITIEYLEQLAEQGLHALDDALLPTENALPDWPSIIATEAMVDALRHGQTIKVEQTFESEKVRLFDANNQFIGLGEMTKESLVSPKRVFVLQNS